MFEFVCFVLGAFAGAMFALASVSRDLRRLNAAYREYVETVETVIRVKNDTIAMLTGDEYDSRRLDPPRNFN